MNLSSGNRTCHWCSKAFVDRPGTVACEHLICSECFISDTDCKSHCPVCRFRNVEQYLRRSQVCAVCCRDVNGAGASSFCPERHQLCAECLPSGCILCQFRLLNSSPRISYRTRSPRDQHVLYTCETWQKKFEEASCVSNGYDSQLLNSGINESQSSMAATTIDSVEMGDCMICLEPLGSTYHRLPTCNHCFHQACIEQWFESGGKQSCPNCGLVYGVSKGPQPPNGRMTIRFLGTVLSGFEHDQYPPHEGPTMEITYALPNGRQGPLNPKPGAPYHGTTRRAYLPNTREGKEILALLRRAFDDQHIFTIGKSVTTGQDDVVTWNDIHHKTSISGGPSAFGYPDPTYLYRVRQELADKGYK